MKNILDNLDSSWVDLLKSELNSQYFLQLKHFLCSEVALGKVIFPKEKEIFEALNLTPLNKVKVVILGQDPYHGENQCPWIGFFCTS